MKKKQFYSHLISLEHVRIELSSLNVSEKEQEELLEIAQKQLHHVMMDHALTQIKGEDKKIFLQHVSKDEHEKAWEVLRKHARDVEKHLLHAAHEVYEELRRDIKELKKE